VQAATFLNAGLRGLLAWNIRLVLLILVTVVIGSYTAIFGLFYAVQMPNH